MVPFKTNGYVNSCSVVTKLGTEEIRSRKTFFYLSYSSHSFFLSSHSSLSFPSTSLLKYINEQQPLTTKLKHTSQYNEDRENECVCVCVRERERERGERDRDRDRDTQRERERERESLPHL